MTKKKWLCISLIVLIVGFLLWGLGEIYGNPFAEQRALKTTEYHLSQKWPNHSFKITNMTHTKSNSYDLTVSSTDSIDTHFTVIIDDNGEFLYDTYEDDVLSGQNTLLRHSAQYREQVESALSGLDYPKQFSAKLEITESITLSPDMNYNIFDLGSEHGCITYRDEIGYIDSYETASEMLLEMKSALDNAGIPFSYARLCQATKKAETTDHRFWIDNIPVSEIHAENLPQKLETYDLYAE